MRVRVEITQPNSRYRGDELDESTNETICAFNVPTEGTRKLRDIWEKSLHRYRHAYADRFIPGARFLRMRKGDGTQVNLNCSVDEIFGPQAPEAERILVIEQALFNSPSLKSRKSLGDSKNSGTPSEHDQEMRDPEGFVVPPPRDGMRRLGDNFFESQGLNETQKSKRSSPPIATHRAPPTPDSFDRDSAASSSHSRTPSHRASEGAGSKTPRLWPLFSTPEVLSSQHSRRSTKSTSKATSQPWTAAEDEAILQGMREGLDCAQILEVYKINRSTSAARNRRVLLRNKYPTLLMHPNDTDDQTPERSEYGWPSSQQTPSRSAHLSTAESPNSALTRLTTISKQRQIWSSDDVSTLRDDLASGLDAREIKEQHFPDRSIDSILQKMKRIELATIEREREKCDWPSDSIRSAGWEDRMYFKLRRAWRENLTALEARMQHNLAPGVPLSRVQDKLNAYSRQMHDVLSENTMSPAAQEGNLDLNDEGIAPCNPLTRDIMSETSMLVSSHGEQSHSPQQVTIEQSPTLALLSSSMTKTLNQVRYKLADEDVEVVFATQIASHPNRNAVESNAGQDVRIEPTTTQNSELQLSPPSRGSFSPDSLDERPALQLSQELERYIASSQNPESDGRTHSKPGERDGGDSWTKSNMNRDGPQQSGDKECPDSFISDKSNTAVQVEKRPKSPKRRECPKLPAQLPQRSTDEGRTTGTRLESLKLKSSPSIATSRIESSSDESIKHIEGHNMDTSYSHPGRQAIEQMVPRKALSSHDDRSHSPLSSSRVPHRVENLPRPNHSESSSHPLKRKPTGHRPQTAKDSNRILERIMVGITPEDLDRSIWERHNTKSQRPENLSIPKSSQISMAPPASDISNPPPLEDHPPSTRSRLHDSTLTCDIEVNSKDADVNTWSEVPATPTSQIGHATNQLEADRSNASSEDLPSDNVANSRDTFSSTDWSQSVQSDHNKDCRIDIKEVDAIDEESPQVLADETGVKNREDRLPESIRPPWPSSGNVRDRTGLEDSGSRAIPGTFETQHVQGNEVHLSSLDATKEDYESGGKRKKKRKKRASRGVSPAARKRDDNTNESRRERNSRKRRRRSQSAASQTPAHVSHTERSDKRHGTRRITETHRNHGAEEDHETVPNVRSPTDASDKEHSALGLNQAKKSEEASNSGHMSLRPHHSLSSLSGSINSHPTTLEQMANKRKAQLKKLLMEGNDSDSDSGSSDDNS